MAKERIKAALIRIIPAPADADVRIFDQVLVYREGPIIKWTGPYTVLSVNGKTVHIEINGRVVQLSIDKVKRFRQPEDDA